MQREQRITLLAKKNAEVSSLPRNIVTFFFDFYNSINFKAQKNNSKCFSNAPFYYSRYAKIVREICGGKRQIFILINGIGALGAVTYWAYKVSTVSNLQYH